MLHMSNLYYFSFAILVIFNVYTSSITINKINLTLQTINEELIFDCVSYKGLIDAIEEDDPKYLYINQEKLKDIINDLLKSNLTNIKHKAEYYFYDNSLESLSYISKEYCNSVQIRITINYQNKKIIKIYRFEPSKGVIKN